MKILGRIHSYDDFLEAFRLSREVGFDNINVDIMYGIPEQTERSFKATLSAISALSPEHISCYGLIIEEGTPFYEWQNSLRLPTEDTEADMYYAAAELLRAEGYSHYEISNYAKRGFECKHNLKYWRDEEYIGVGLAAHSYFNSVRYSNPSEMSEYFAKTSEEKQSAPSGEKKDPFEYAMLRLRLAEGLALDEYKSLFSLDFKAGKEDLIEKLKKEGYMIEKGGSLSLSERGFYVSNYILSQLL
jgi:oxygen-independent coproporphyrinogen-3 oxidase